MWKKLGGLIAAGAKHIGANIAPYCIVVVAVGAIVAIYTNFNANMMMRLQQNQIENGQYQQYQGSIALAWRTIGEANGQPFEVGQSRSVLYLAQNRELRGSVILNSSFLALGEQQPGVAIGENTPYVNLSNSALCSSYVSNWRLNIGNANFSYSFLRRSSLDGGFQSDDFLASDMRDANINNLNGSNARFAAVDLRGALFQGGRFIDADFQGADLRGVKTQRGYLGLGYGEGSYFELYNPDPVTRIDWPKLFEQSVGIGEMLEAVGRPPTAPNANFVVDFTKANFREADLRGADLSNSNISQTQANDACVDGTTIFPQGVKKILDCSRSPILEEKLRILRTPLVQNARSARSCERSLVDEKINTP